ncbi:otolin-1-A-like [Saccostrea cucullata]|uniref:otolin-1-A-like n=1 Tax=Saccostrea cuccullata TaxID=36930 RepID=UPI002ED47812
MAANEAYVRNLKEGLSNAVNNINDIKVQLRYTSLSLLDVHSKTAILNTTLTGYLNNLADITKKVAFTAGVTSDSSSWMSGTLVFDRIVYTIGGGYDLILNGSAKVTTAADTSGSYDTGSNMAVLRLQKGDRVWIKYYMGSGYSTRSSAPVTTFSGFLLY